MAMEIDEAVIRVDNHAEIDEVEPIEISDDEARRVRLYENFYQVNAIDPALYAAARCEARPAQRRRHGRARGYDQYL